MSLRDDITADLEEIFSTDDFAVSATWKFDGTGAGTSINVHFVNEFDAALTEPNQVESSGPYVLAKWADVSNAGRSSRVTIDAVLYHVIGIQPHSEAITKLILSRDS